MVTPMYATGIPNGREYGLSATALQSVKFWILQTSGFPVAACCARYRLSANPANARRRMTASPTRFTPLQYAQRLRYANGQTICYTQL